MKQFFDKRLYRESIREIKSLSIVMLVLGTITTVLTWFFRRGVMLSYYTSISVYNTVDIALFGVMILGSNLIARKLVSFAWSQSKTDMVYSSPYSKKQIFCTKAIAALTMQFALLIIIGIIGTLLTFKHLGEIVFLSDIIVTTLNMMLGSAIIIAAVFFSIGVTGRKNSSALIADWIVLAPALLFIVRHFTGTYMQIGYKSYLVQKFDLYILSNLLMKTLGEYDATRYLPSIIIGLLLAIGIFIAGYVLFKKRSGELTGNYTKNKFVHFLMIGFLPFVIAFITFLYLFTEAELSYDVIRLAVFFFGIAAISVFVQERVINQKIGKNNRCIWVYLACMVLSLAIVYPVYKAANRDDSREISSEEVESVNFLNYGQHGSLFRYRQGLTYGEYLSEEYSIDSTRIINKIIDLYALRNEDYHDFSKMTMQLVEIKLKSGASIFARVPVFFMRHNDCGDIETDLDDALYSVDEYMKLLYAPMPNENITFIYDSYMYQIEDRQDTLRNILNELTDEFDVLGYDIKREIKAVNSASWGLSYDNIVDNFDEDCIIPIGYLYVRGRVGSDMMIDRYKLTSYTPNASNAYIQMVYEQNIESYREFLEQYKNTSVEKNEPYNVVVYYMDDENRLKIISGNSFVYGLFGDEYRLKLGDVIKEFELQMPQLGDTFVVVDYIDEDVDVEGSRSMFIKIDEEQLAELMEIYQEYTQ